MTDDARDPDPDEPFTRRKIKVKIGDGPDQRGEVTIETVREPDDEHQNFAEWKFEVDRSVAVLRDTLGLDAPDDDADPAPDPYANTDADPTPDGPPPSAGTGETDGRGNYQ